MKILHITNWYPNSWNEHEGIFIREQFNVFSRVFESKIVNVQVREGKNWFEYRHVVYNDKESAYFILTKISKYKLIELLSTGLLLWVLRSEKLKNFDLLHVHIAYPLLVHYRWWKKWIKMKIVMSEHWSAYHFHFWMPKSTHKLDIIKNVFRQNIPVITVSNALLNDIREFSGVPEIAGEVIPNIIDQRIFHFRERSYAGTELRLFMVNIWREIKNPFPVIDACQKLTESGVKITLILGGDGPLLALMKQHVLKNSLGDGVVFLGAMSKEAIADELAKADAYLVSSTYETFSVACVQALCCGVPLIGPAIPAIREYADDEVMVTVADNNVAGWEQALRKFIEKRNNFSRKEVAERAAKRFSTERAADMYRALIGRL